MRFSHRIIYGAATAFVSVCIAGALPSVAEGMSFPQNTQEVTTPTVIGTVTDSSGRPLSNAEVIVTQLNRVTPTNAAGQFRFRQLPAGTYEIVAMLVGYAPVRQTITVGALGDSVRVDLVMRRTSVSLATVQVTGSATSTDVHDVTQSTVQLSGQALSRVLGASVGQTLAGEPGMAMRYGGPSANVPIIRGLTGDRILVLENGERTGDLSSAAPDHALTIDPLAAQRIEVVRGPESLLYGSNALGGVVNVISGDIPTNVPLHVTGYLGTQTESVNPGGAFSAAVTVPLGQSFALSGRGNMRSISDTRQGGGDKLLNSSSQQSGGALGLGFVGRHVTGGVAYEGTRFKYGLPGTIEDDEFGARIRGNRHQATARSNFIIGTRGMLSARVDATAQWYSHDEIESSGEIGTSFNLKTQTINATAKTLFGVVSGAVGVSGLFKQYGATGEEALTPAADTRSGGIFVFQDIPLVRPSAATDLHDVAHLHLGARYDMYHIDSKEGDPKFGAAHSLRFNSGSGSIGLVVPVMPAVSLAGSVSRAFRAPTVEELFSNAMHEAAGTYDIGNPDLKAETNTGAEAVLRVHTPRVNAQVSAYYNRIDNYVLVNIVGDTVNDEGDAAPINRYSQGDATLRGAEASIEGEVARNIVLGAMGDLVRGSLKSGEPLPFMPPARLGAQARYDNGVYNVGAEYRYGFKQHRAPAAVGDEDPSALATDAYHLVNFAAGYTLSRLGVLHTIVLRVDNIFDEQYKDATSRIKVFAYNPGRNVSLVYKVMF